MKLITKIVGATLGLAMALGVALGVANNNKQAVGLDADSATYQEKTLANLSAGDQVLIVTQPSSGTTKYYVPVSTSYTGSAISNSFTVTDVNSIDDSHLWTVEKNDSNYAFKFTDNNKTYYLTVSGTGTGNKPRISTTTTYKNWTIATTANGNSMQNASTSNYLGVYTSGSDWRVYASADHANLGGTGQRIRFYEKTGSAFGTLDHIKVTTQPTKRAFFVGETFSCPGLVLTGYDAVNENTAHTETYSTNFTTSYNGHTFVDGDKGIQTVTVTYSGKTATYSIEVNDAPDVLLDKDNTPFTSSSNSNTGEEDVELDGIEYHNLAGYNFGNYLSFNKSQSGAYLSNNTPFDRNISKITVDFNSGSTSLFTMYEGITASAESSTISSTSQGTERATYTFSDENQFFKFKLTTTGTYCNIVRIGIYYGSEHVTHEVDNVIASIKDGTYYVGSTLSASDFDVTVEWTNGKADTHPTEGFTWTVNGTPDGSLRKGNNAVVLTYENVESDPFNVVGSVPPATGISILDSNVSLLVGHSSKLSASLIPATAEGLISWSSSNNNVVSVDNNGVISGIATGSATITATHNTFTDTCVVKVSQDSLEATLEYTGNANKTCADYQGNALTEILNLNPGVFTVIYNKNGAGSDTALRTDGIRMYATKNTTSGNKITVRVASGYTINSINIDFDADYSDTAVVSNSSSVLTPTDDVYTVNDREFTIFNNNSNVNTNTQVRFQSISISFAESAGHEIGNSLYTTSSLSYDYENEQYSNVAIRFGGLVSKTLWDELDTGSHVIEAVGVLFSNADRIASLENIDSLKDCYDAARAQSASIDAAIAKACNDYGILYRQADVSESIPALTGENNYKWNLVKKVSSTYFAKEYVATAYIIANNEIIFLQQTSASVNGLLAA